MALLVLLLLIYWLHLEQVVAGLPFEQKRRALGEEQG
jgi:hypothetical protein